MNANKWDNLFKKFENMPEDEFKTLVAECDKDVWGIDKAYIINTENTLGNYVYDNYVYNVNADIITKQQKITSENFDNYKNIIYYIKEESDFLIDKYDNLVA